MLFRAGSRISESLTLVRPLGRGGMGSVWVARHDKLETDVAVKFVATGLEAQAPSVLGRFRKEAALSAQLRSPHVVKTFDCGELDDGRPYLVMELLAGETLGALLARRERLEPAELTTLVAQLAGVLDEAHGLGIVHRDIKPDNIFVLDSGHELFVKVLDFGIAKQLPSNQAKDVTSPGALWGTPEYMSPEQLLSSRTAEPQSDLWSLAVVADRALVGRVPFSGETLAALSLAICHSDYGPPSEGGDFAVDLDAFFARAFATSPKDRFATAAAMSEALKATFSNASLLGGPSPPRYAAPKPDAAAQADAQARAATMSGSSTEVGGGHRRSRSSSPRFVAATLACGLALAILADAALRRAAPAHVANAPVALPSVGDPWADAAPEPSVEHVLLSAPVELPVATPPLAPSGTSSSPPPRAYTTPVVVGREARGSKTDVDTATTQPRVKPECKYPYELDREGDLVPKPGCM